MKKIYICTFLIIQQIIFLIFTFKSEYKNNKEYLNEPEIIKNKKIDYQNNYFAILTYTACPSCGLFGYYIVYIACIKTLILNGYIPIIDLKSFQNIFNGFNINFSEENPWEYFFNQPFGLTLKNVQKYGKKIKYVNCEPEPLRPRCYYIYTKTATIDFWHNFAYRYIPIKKKIIKETENVIKKLFGNSLNILGILIRGTDYLAIKPGGHPITPEAKIVIKDVKELDKKYKYDWFFIATEDNIIRNKFIKEFGNKIKYLAPIKNIKYDYKSKKYLAFHKNIGGNLNYLKIYLISIIILSKCLDIITCRTNGSVGTFIFTKGFRYFKVYYLGTY